MSAFWDETLGSGVLGNILQNGPVSQRKRGGTVGVIDGILQNQCFTRSSQQGFRALQGNITWIPPSGNSDMSYCQENLVYQAMKGGHGGPYDSVV